MKIFTPKIFGSSVEAGIWIPGPDNAVVLHQTHSGDVHELDSEAKQPDGDGLYTDKPGQLLAMRVADCVAVLLYDPEHRAVAAVHSGWRGTKAGIVPNMVEALNKTYGTDPDKLLAYISPAGQVCCYEVGPEFKDYFPGKYFEERGGKLYFDNSGLVYAQLNEAGVPHENIEWDERCTIDDPNFPSYRRDKTTNRMFVAIALKA